MKNRFHVTYEIVTHESAEHGDCADRGFIDARGLPESIREANFNARDWSELHERNAMTLREALRECSPQEDCGAWFTECDGRENYQTGAVETRALHPADNISAASYDRLKRLLFARR